MFIGKILGKMSRKSCSGKRVQRERRRRGQLGTLNRMRSLELDSVLKGLYWILKSVRKMRN